MLNALTRSRSARTCFARRCWPSAERSASWDRSAALAPVSMPSDVALSGSRRRRSSATLVEQLQRVGASFDAGGAGAPSRAHADISGRAAADASAARAFTSGKHPPIVGQEVSDS